MPDRLRELRDCSTVRRLPRLRPIAPEKNSQLLNEIKLLSRFQHDNIVAYLGSAVVGPHVLPLVPLHAGQGLEMF